MSLMRKVLKAKLFTTVVKQSYYQNLYVAGVINEDKCEDLCGKNIMSYLNLLERYCEVNGLDFDKYLEEVGKHFKKA